MEDVIFAGTAGRPPLGRAEVTLTIDNTDGALPIEYTEVSITPADVPLRRERVRDQRRQAAACSTSRSCSATPASAARCTSSSGRASSTPSCPPAPRTAAPFIEEAAGVLKHRKRKEKALRKLDAMQANLDRLADLTAELRRQLKPLGRQAEVARRAPASRPTCATPGCGCWPTTSCSCATPLDRDVADETALRARRTAVERAGRGAAARVRAGDRRRRARAAAPRARTPGTGCPRCSERFRGVAQLAAERHAHLSAAPPADARPGRDPDQLDGRGRPGPRPGGRAGRVSWPPTAPGCARPPHAGRAEAAPPPRRRRSVAAVRALADRREGLARLPGRSPRARPGSAAAEAEIDRLAGALQEAAPGPRRRAGELSALRDAGRRARRGRGRPRRRARGRASRAPTGRPALVCRADEAERAPSATARLGGPPRRPRHSAHPQDGAAALLARPAGPAVARAGRRPRRSSPGRGGRRRRAGRPPTPSWSAGGRAAAALARLQADDAGRAGLLGRRGRADAPAPARRCPTAPAGRSTSSRRRTALRPALSRLLAGSPSSTTWTRPARWPSARPARGHGGRRPARRRLGGRRFRAARRRSRGAAAVDEATPGRPMRRRRRAARREAAAAREVAAARGRSTRRSPSCTSATPGWPRWPRARRAGPPARAAAAEAGRLGGQPAAEQARDRDLSGLAELEERLAAPRPRRSRRSPRPSSATGSPPSERRPVGRGRRAARGAYGRGAGPRARRPGRLARTGRQGGTGGP